MRNPPILVAVLGFFAALAGFGHLFFGLRVLGFDWFGLLGDLPAFESVGLWGWLAVMTGIVWLLVALGLWGLQPWARTFTLIVAGFVLLEAVIAFFQFPGTGVGFAMAIVPIFILWYLMSRDVKAAFAGEEPKVVAPTPVAAAAAAPPAAAPVAAAAFVAAEPVAAQPDVVPATPVVAAAALAPDAAEAPVAEAPASGGRMSVVDVEGIGPASGEKLAAIGIKTTDDLLTAGATPHARERIAEQTGISGDLIRKWVDKVDLMRIDGVGPQYSDLLEAAGVGSPAELAQRNPVHLAITLQEVVAARPGIVRRTPNEAEVAAWVAEAGSLPPVVDH